MPDSITWIILAAGGSTRFGGARSKLLSAIDDRRVIDMTLEAAKTALPSAEILLVSTPELRDEIGFQGLWVAGGALRQLSAANGIRRANRSDVYLIHDAARPFFTPALIAKLLRALDTFDAVAPGLPVTDTLKRVKGSAIVETITRSELFSVQTPQALRGGVARSAFARIDAEREFTDDLAVIEHFGEKTGIVAGEKENMKITTPMDIDAARLILRSRSANARRNAS